MNRHSITTTQDIPIVLDQICLNKLSSGSLTERYNRYTGYKKELVLKLSLMENDVKDSVYETKENEAKNENNEKKEDEKIRKQLHLIEIELKTLKDIILESINMFSKENVVSDERYSEVIIYAALLDKDLVHSVEEAFYKKLTYGTHLFAPQVEWYARMLQCINLKEINIDGNLIFNQFKDLLETHNQLYDKKDTNIEDPDTVVMFRAFATLVDVMVLMDNIQLDARTLNDLRGMIGPREAPGAKGQELGCLGSYIFQGLYRIQNGATTWKLYCGEGLKVVTNVVGLVGAAFVLNIGGLIGGIEKTFNSIGQIQKTRKGEGEVHEWFSQVYFLRKLLANTTKESLRNEEDGFLEKWQKISDSMGSNRKDNEEIKRNVLYFVSEMIIEYLKDTIVEDLDEELTEFCCDLIEVLAEQYTLALSIRGDFLIKGNIIDCLKDMVSIPYPEKLRQTSRRSCEGINKSDTSSRVTRRSSAVYKKKPSSSTTKLIRKFKNKSENVEEKVESSTSTEWDLGSIWSTINRVDYAKINRKLPWKKRNHINLNLNTYLLEAYAKQRPLEFRLERIRQLSDGVRTEIRKDLEAYIPLDWADLLHEDVEAEDKNLDSALEAFLASDNRKILVLCGEAGSGKSLFCYQREEKLWSNYIRGGTTPIFIPLASLGDIKGGLFNKYFDRFDISSGLYQQRSREYIFFLDGLDEISDVAKNVLHQVNVFSKSMRAKFIITSRTDTIEKIGKNVVRNILQSKMDNKSNVEIKKIEKFDSDKRDMYYKVLAKKGRLIWTVDQVTKIIDGISGLTQLLTNPYMLHVLIETLPTIISTNIGIGDQEELETKIDDLSLQTDKVNEFQPVIDDSDQSKILTRASIYNIFTQGHFRREAKKLESTSKLQEFDPEYSFFNFSKDLAVNMWCEGLVVVSSQGNSYPSPTTRNLPESNHIINKLFTMDPILVLIRSGVQLRSSGGKDRAFRHKSLQEYFTACVLFEEIQMAKSVDLANLYLNRRSLLEDPGIIKFLSDMLIVNRSESINKLKGILYSTATKKVKVSDQMTTVTSLLLELLSQEWDGQTEKLNYLNQMKSTLNQNYSNDDDISLVNSNAFVLLLHLGYQFNKQDIEEITMDPLTEVAEIGNVEAMKLFEDIYGSRIRQMILDKEIVRKCIVKEHVPLLSYIFRNYNVFDVMIDNDSIFKFALDQKKSKMIDLLLKLNYFEHVNEDHDTFEGTMRYTMVGDDETSINLLFDYAITQNITNVGENTKKFIDEYYPKYSDGLKQVILKWMTKFDIYLNNKSKFESLVENQDWVSIQSILEDRTVKLPQYMTNGDTPLLWFILSVGEKIYPRSSIFSTRSNVIASMNNILEKGVSPFERGVDDKYPLELLIEYELIDFLKLYIEKCIKIPYGINIFQLFNDKYIEQEIVDHFVLLAWIQLFDCDNEDETIQLYYTIMNHIDDSTHPYTPKDEDEIQRLLLFITERRESMIPLVDSVVFALRYNYERILTRMTEWEYIYNKLVESGDKKTFLHYCFAEDNLVFLRQCFDQMKNKTDSKGRTPIYYAKSIDALNHAIKIKHYNFKVIDADEFSPVWYTASNGETKLLRWYIDEEGVDINTIGPENNTFLHIAASFPPITSLEMLNFLIKARIDLTTPNSANIYAIDLLWRDETVTRGIFNLLSTSQAKKIGINYKNRGVEPPISYFLDIIGRLESDTLESASTIFTLLSQYGAEIIDQTFVNLNLQGSLLADNIFDRCAFIRCDLRAIYRENTIIKHCTFDDCLGNTNISFPRQIEVEKPVWKLAVSPDNRLLAVGMGEKEDCELGFYSLETFEMVGTGWSLIGYVTALSFAPDSTKLYVASFNMSDRTVAFDIFRTNTIEPECWYNIESNLGDTEIERIVFANPADQLLFVTANTGGSLRIWNEKNSSFKKKLKMLGTIYDLSVMDDQNKCVVAVDDKIKIVNLTKPYATREVIQYAEGYVRGAQYDMLDYPSNNRIPSIVSTGLHMGSICVRLSHSTCLETDPYTLEDLYEHLDAYKVRTIGGRYVVSARENQDIALIIYDVRDRRVIATVTEEEAVGDFVITADERYIISGGLHHIIINKTDYLGITL